jgi:hypothetical protein
MIGAQVNQVPAQVTVFLLIGFPDKIMNFTIYSFGCQVQLKSPLNHKG